MNDSVVVHEHGDRDAPAMVLLHGLTEAGTTWPDAVEHWGGWWRMLAVDLRGHGGSPRFTADELSDSAAVIDADVAGVLASVSSPAVVVGHSLGGIFALRAAYARPDLVRGLVLEDPARPTIDRPPPQEFVEQQERFLDAMLEPAAEIVRTRNETTWSEAEIQAWAACKPLVDRAYIRSGVDLGRERWSELVDGVEIPTLLVLPAGGEADEVETANPALTIVRIPGVGHCIRRDDPAAYFGAVDAFLADLRTR